MAGSPVRVERLCVSAGGRKLIDELSFSLEAGDVLGVLAKERQSRSALLDVLTGLSFPSSGKVTLFGKATGTRPSGIGCLLRPLVFYEGWTARANLEYWAALSGLEDRMRLDRLARALGVEAVLGGRVRSLSSSQRTRLALVAALSEGERLSLLEEPLRGLDGGSARLVARLVKGRARKTGTPALVVSRSVREIEDLCSEVIVLEMGREIHRGPVYQIEATCHEVVIELDDAPRAAQDLIRVRGMGAEITDERTVRLSGRSSSSDAIAFLVGRGHRIEGLRREGVELEELLMRLSRGPLPPAPEGATPSPPEEVEDVLELLDDSDRDLSEFLKKSPTRKSREARGARENGEELSR